MNNKDLIIILLVILLVVAFMFIIRVIFWKTLKIHHVAETYTTIGIRDIKMMSSLNGTCGVWAQYVGNKCWNVCKTRNMGMEMAHDSRRCLQALDNTMKSDKRLRKDFTYKGSIAIQYRNLIKYATKHRGKIKFVVIFTSDTMSDEMLEFEEMKYAVLNKAINWRPAPGKQTKLYYNYKNNGGNINKYKKFVDN